MNFRANNKGFTLVEILVVLALTLIVMGLIFGPLIQTFKITRQAETIIRAQDNARMGLSQITSDLSNAMYVYDNTRDPINFPVLNAMGNSVIRQVLYAKVDLVLPKMRCFCPNDSLHTPGGIQRGQEAAPICPVCGELLDLKPVQPLVPDTNIVRYFVGLKDPTQPYYNGFNSKLAEADKKDNTYVLYRVEFNPFDNRLFANADQEHFNDNLSDPDFFYNPSFAAAWRSISRPVVTLNDIDLITIEYDPAGNPIVTPTVKFAPTAVYNDPLMPTLSAEDEPDRGDAPPTMYKASYGHWVLPYKVMLDAGDGVTYETMPGINTAGQDPPTDMCIYRKAGTTLKEQVFVFNITHYLNTKDVSPYGVGEMWPSSIDDREKAFTVDTMRGTVNCAFPNCYQSYCDKLNSSISTSLGGSMALSETWNSFSLNKNTYRRLVVNNVKTSDPRVFANGTVILGSFKVIAPDALRPQTPSLVPYTRSAFLTQDPGVNQFAVDAEYDNSTPGSAAIYFHLPRTAEPSGDLTFPTTSVKTDVLIYYEVQNNRKGDLLRANYVTKELMTIIMGIRIYDTNSGRVQAIQLTNKMRLKNIAG